MSIERVRAYVRKLQWLYAWLSWGCVGSTPTATEIPNLHEVRPGLWRSGQPMTASHWQQVKTLGVKHVIKLNFRSEGSDDGARAIGLIVYELSIQPEGDQDILDALLGTFMRPDLTRLAEAEQVIQVGGGVLVHCTYGRDRTGYVVGQTRVLDDHWTKDEAYSEMSMLGFHSSLRGLREAWEDWKPAP
jgi:hypothetical protein